MSKKSSLKEVKTNNVSTIEQKRHNFVDIIPRNTAQEKYLAALNNKFVKMIFAVGPAGTFKTGMAVLQAIRLLKTNQIKKIIITRPLVSTDEELGFLPGTVNEKMWPWLMPIMDVFDQFWKPDELNAMINDRVIEVAPLAYMRGRTFTNCFIIADEIQLTTPNQLKMLLTRMGDGSRMCITGDLLQADQDKRGLHDFVKRYKAAGKTYSEIEFCEFEHKHVERSQITKDILEIYGDS